MTVPDTRQARGPLRVLFLCTANAARSQIAEALLTKKAAGRFVTASAGESPATAVHPMALGALREYGIDWSDRSPKGLEAVAGEPWDFVITVCERAREQCPVIPGTPIYADWGVEDPTIIDDEARRWFAFRRTVQQLARRIDLMLAVSMEKLVRQAQDDELRAIGQASESDDSATLRPATPGTATNTDPVAPSPAA
jgi:protein-tyrosine-phosphatase